MVNELYYIYLVIEMRFQEENGFKIRRKQKLFILNVKTAVLLMKNKWKLMFFVNEVHRTADTLRIE